jgi:tRNA pseudouridine55 synthase
MKRKPALVHGILAIDKPAGATSRKVLDSAARLLGERRAGHCGTLDPPATGLLVCAFGEATKAVPWLMAASKTYETEIAFGTATSTDDATGTPLHTAPVPPDLERRVADWLKRHVGAMQQAPPVVSALHRDGQRAHDRVRRGQSVELVPRPVELREAELLGGSRDRVWLRLRCGAGFYVRSLARDLGAALGSAAHVTSLRRTAACGLDAGNAMTLAALAALDAADRCKRLVPLAVQLQRVLPWVTVDAAIAAVLRQGKKPPLPVAAPDRDAAALLVLDDADQAVAVVRLANGVVQSILRGFVALPPAKTA